MMPPPESASAQCPRCGAHLWSQALGGLCPRCLMRRAWTGFAGGVAEASPGVGGARRFGPFELLGELGRGGAGVVYRARDPELGREVALKVLLAGEWASRAFVERFRTEATAAAALTHPHIVPVHGFGEIDGRHYLVMRLVPGGTLAEALGRPGGRPGADRAAGLVARLARAVHHAHQRGVLHRDLKPANVLLDEQGEPLLVDFGLAKLVARDGALTQTHAVLGTPAYMPPEQAARRMDEVTTSADVYGLGAILYELLTGQPPFSGGTSAETVRRVLEEQPRPLRDLNPSVPRDLAVIALKALEKDPARRYGSAEALADELDRWQRHEPILARPAPAWERAVRWTRRRPWLAAAVGVAITALVVIGGVVGWSNRRLRMARIVIESQAEQRRQQLVRLSVAAGDQAVRDGDGGSALGHYVAALRLDAGSGESERPHRERIQLMLGLLPVLETVWTNAGGLRDAALDERGGRLAVAGADGRALLWTDAAAIAPVVLTHPAAVDSVAFNAAGNRLLTLARDHRARLWAADTGQLIADVPAARADPTPLETALRAAVFSPDGTCWALSGTNGVELRSVADGKQLWSRPGGRRVNDLAFSPDGTQLAWADEDSTLGIAAATTGEVLWRRNRDVGIRRVWFSPDGLALAWADEAFRFGIVRVADGADRFAPRLHRRLVLDATFSPDGTHFATASYDNTARVWDAITGRPITPLMRHEGAVRRISYAAGGGELLTASDDGTVGVWRAETGERSRPVLRLGGPVAAACWLPGGAGVLTAAQDGELRRWRWRPDEGAVRCWRRAAPVHRVFFVPRPVETVQVWLDGLVRSAPLDPAREGDAVEFQGVGHAADAWPSPDGRRVLTLDMESQLRVQDAASGAMVAGPWPAAARPFQPACNSDGTRVLVARHGQPPALYDATTGRQIPVPSVDRVKGNGGWFSPDGNRLLLLAFDGMLHLVSPQDGRAIGSPLRPGGATWSVAWAPDSRRFVRLSGDGIEGWDAETGRVSGVRYQLPEPVLLLRFSRDGTDLAVASDHFLGVIDAASGAPRFAPVRHAESVLALDVSPDGHRVLTATADGRVFLWQLKSGMSGGPPLPHRGYVVGAAFNDQGMRILTADNAGAIRLWDTSRCELPLAELEALADRWRGGVSIVVPK